MARNHITVADAATQTGYSREHIRRLALAGAIESSKIGWTVLVNIVQLKARKKKQAKLEAERKSKDETK